MDVAFHSALVLSITLIISRKCNLITLTLITNQKSCITNVDITITEKELKTKDRLLLLVANEKRETLIEYFKLCFHTVSVQTV